MLTLADRLDQFPREGRIEWIGIRPVRRGAVQSVVAVRAQTGRGLEGDHYQGGSGSRGVTLIQFEHLAALASLMEVSAVAPELLRRNLLVSGLNLMALKGRRFQVGEAVLESTGPCHPCSRMDESLGPGGLNAMRGHGGITARVLSGGQLRVGDAVRVLPDGVDLRSGGSEVAEAR